MSVVLEQKQGLIAGDGLLPVKMAQYAKENGFDVVAISLSDDNYKQLYDDGSFKIYERLGTKSPFVEEMEIK